MHSSHVSKTSSTATSTSTTTSVTTSGGSQPELTAEQCQQGSLVDHSTAVLAPGSTFIPTDDQQFAGLRLLAEVSTSQLDPFEALAAHRPVTFHEDQEQSASSLSLLGEPSQAADDAPIIKVEEPHELGFTVLPDNKGEDTEIITTISNPRNQVMSSINDHFQGAVLGTVPEALLTKTVAEPKLPSGQNVVDQKAGSTNKWIVYSGDKTRPFKCCYEGCGKTYPKKFGMASHITAHIRDSQFRCYDGACTGAIRYPSKRELTRHIHKNHTFERPYDCNICGHRFRRSHHLKYHVDHIHAPGREKKPPKLKKK